MDLLDAFMENTKPVEQHPQDEYFSQHFWGDKNLGFDVLYQNMKHGHISVKDLQEFIKENAYVEELYAKHMTKLAKQASNCSPLGTFSPLMEVLRGMTEKLSSCHMDIVLRMHDIARDLTKYLEEQKSKQKQLKEQLSGTADALHNLQMVTASVTKTKEKYNQQCIEAERIRRANAPTKDLDKALSKTSKVAEEYRQLVEKHANIREMFEQRMMKSCQEFQKIEDYHLNCLKGFLNSYILSFENASVLINQVHREFRRQVNEKTIDKLIREYAEQKGTGIEHPAPLVFEECDPGAVLATMENGAQALNQSTSTEGSQISTTSNKHKKEPGSGIFGLRRRKPKTKHDTTNNSVGSRDSKDTESIESPDKEREVKIDDEGYSIRPEREESDKASYRFTSDSDSDSDSDDPMSRKIQVRIKPKEATDSGGSDLETLNAITKNLTLGSPSPMGIKKPNQSDTESVHDLQNRTDSSKQSKSDKMSNEELLLLFSKGVSSSGGTSSPNSNSTRNQANHMASQDSSSDLFSNVQSGKARTGSTTSKKGPAPPPPVESNSSSDNSTSNLSQVSDVPPPRPPKPSDPIQNTPAESNNLTRPVDLGLASSAKTEPNKSSLPGYSAPLASSESWSSLSSAGGFGTPTQPDNFQSNFTSVSRGPSPLTLSFNDPIPIAVAFIETVNAYFKGIDPAKSLTKITGEVLISFPAGIVRALTSNPDPALLSFQIKCGDQTTLSNISHNGNLLHKASMLNMPHAYSFNMPALVSHIKKLTEKEPDNPYYNITIINYLVASSHQTMPLHITSNWNCESTNCEININYKYNAASTSAALKNLNVVVPIHGTVTDVQSTPQGVWNSAQNRLCWQIPGTLSASTPSGSLNGKLELSSGPSKPTTLAVQFLADGSSLSGADFELVGNGYRISLVKKQFMSGKYLSGV